MKHWKFYWLHETTSVRYRHKINECPTIKSTHSSHFMQKNKGHLQIFGSGLGGWIRLPLLLTGSGPACLTPSLLGAGVIKHWLLSHQNPLTWNTLRSKVFVWTWRTYLSNFWNTWVFSTLSYDFQRHFQPGNLVINQKTIFEFIFYRFFSGHPECLAWQFDFRYCDTDTFRYCVCFWNTIHPLCFSNHTILFGMLLSCFTLDYCSHITHIYPRRCNRNCCEWSSTELTTFNSLWCV